MIFHEKRFDPSFASHLKSFCCFTRYIARLLFCDKMQKKSYSAFQLVIFREVAKIVKTLLNFASASLSKSL